MCKKRCKSFNCSCSTCNCRSFLFVLVRVWRIVAAAVFSAALFVSCDGQARDEERWTFIISGVLFSVVSVSQLIIICRGWGARAPVTTSNDYDNEISLTASLLALMVKAIELNTLSDLGNLLGICALAPLGLLEAGFQAVRLSAATGNAARQQSTRTGNSLSQRLAVSRFRNQARNRRARSKNSPSTTQRQPPPATGSSPTAAPSSNAHATHPPNQSTASTRESSQSGTARLGRSSVTATPTQGTQVQGV